MASWFLIGLIVGSPLYLCRATGQPAWEWLTVDVVFLLTVLSSLWLDRYIRETGPGSLGYGLRAFLSSIPLGLIIIFAVDSWNSFLYAARHDSPFPTASALHYVSVIDGWNVVSVLLTCALAGWAALIAVWLILEYLRWWGIEQGYVFGWQRLNGRNASEINRI